MTKKLSLIVAIMWAAIIGIDLFNPAGKYETLSIIRSFLGLPSIMLLILIPIVHFRSRKSERRGEPNVEHSTLGVVEYIIIAFAAAFGFLVLLVWLSQYL